jgi:outer membrane protein OmpA-like peptidoglycan-associated protein
MAQLDVQPKRRGPVYIWIIFAILAIAAAVLLYRGCNRTAPLKVDALDTLHKSATDTSGLVNTHPDWQSIDLTIPKTSYGEIADSSITVRGNDKYTIYSLNENDLFGADQTVVQPQAESTLQKVAKSLAKRYPTSAIAIYGQADSAGANQMNGAAHAYAVRKWFITKGGVDSTKISVQSLVGKQPSATDATASGRTANRTLDIVALANGKTNK